MIIESPFKPASWLKNAHLQSVWPALVSRGSGIFRHRERVITPDNDFLDLDWCQADQCQPHNPLVIIMHGLAGSSSSAYVTGLQSSLQSLDWRSVAINFRGCSGEPNRTVRGYYSGDTDDIDFIYQLLRTREPRSPIFVVGFSLGANILLKWLGEQGSSLDIAAAAAVSVPFRLDYCADHMDTGFAKTYQFRLVRHMRRCVQLRLKMFERNGEIEQARCLRNLGQLRGYRNFRKIDHHVTAPLHGFNSAEHYYQRCSSGFFLNKIQSPVLIIQAKDDPFMPASVIPDTAQLSTSTTLELSQGGGHIGFIGGENPWRPEYYLDQRIPAWFKEFSV